MIRFMPDTWQDLLWRPLDMVSPESALYVEFAAPDIRLLFALVLAAIVLAGWRWGWRLNRSTAWLLAITVLAYFPWMGTSGNGRYFIPFLLLLGPLCIGLVRALPSSRAFQLTCILMLVIVQAYLVYLRPPWRFMSWLPWRDAPYFALSLPKLPADQTYVMVEVFPYSLIAPQFPQQSRWITLPALAGPREQMLARRFLQAGHDLNLIVPSSIDTPAADHQPSPKDRRFLDGLVQAYGLSLPPQAHCEFLPSTDIVNAFSRETPDAKAVSNSGLWLCPLRFDPAAAGPSPAPLSRDEARAQEVLDAVERLCPRYFPQGAGINSRLGEAHVRTYRGADTRLYLLSSGLVLYKFWQSLNPSPIGTADQILQGQVQFDCARIRTPNWRTGGL